MSVSFFAEFAAAGNDSWSRQAKAELGEKFNMLSRWEITPDVFANPYETEENLDTEQVKRMRECQKLVPGWLNLPCIKLSAPTETNKAIRAALREGADGVFIDLEQKQLAAGEIARLMHHIKLNETPVYFKSTQPVADLFKAISNHTGYLIKGGIAVDPVAGWMRSGVDYHNAMESVSAFLKKEEAASDFRPLMVESHIYHNNGANPVQELALTIAALATYMDALTDSGIPALRAFNSIFLSVSVGTRYLTEIAKLRALRHLLQKICRAYDLPGNQVKPFIHAKTSSFYHSANASYANMIRAGSEAMSAVIGGCDAVTVEGFQSHLPEEPELSSRIARNVSPVLSYESGLNVVADPAGGSYTIEKMSILLSDAAWALFIDMEERGGLVKCFEKGFIQELLEDSSRQKLADLKNGDIMIGVNKFTEQDQSIPPVNTSNSPDLHLLRDTSLPELFQKHQNSL